MLALEVLEEQIKMQEALNDWAKKQTADQRIADGYRAAVEAAWGMSSELAGSGGEAREAAREEALLRADQLSVVDPNEMPGGRPKPEDFASTTERVTYRMASTVVELAEREEAQAQAWAVRVGALEAKMAAAQETLDGLRESIGRKSSFAARQDESVAQGADDLRNALEVAMMKSRSSQEAKSQSTPESQPLESMAEDDDEEERS